MTRLKSAPIKKRGGRRPGAGRKRSAASLLHQSLFESVLASVNAKDKWIEILKSKDDRVKVDAMKYLTDRVHGKPAQSVLLGADQNKPLEILIRVIGSAN